jgi:hypothetical protein
VLNGDAAEKLRAFEAANAYRAAAPIQTVGAANDAAHFVSVVPGGDEPHEDDSDVEAAYVPRGVR